VDDTLLLGRAMAGDLDSYGQLYDRYFTRVYDFAWRVLRDQIAASDATAQIFSIAARNVREAGKGDAFAPWLFSLAHRVVVERAERAGGVTPDASFEEAFGAFDAPDPASLEDPSVVGGDAELPPLVWEAVSILSPRDYALLDLHLRQGMEAHDLAPILGVHQREARAIIERMRAMAGNVLADYVLARRSTCAALDGALAEAGFPPYNDTVRRAIDDHVASHAECASARNALPPLLPLFASFAAIAAPFAIKGDIWADLATAWRAPQRDDVEPFAEEPAESPYAGAAIGAAAAGAVAGAGFSGGGYGDRRVLLGGNDSADWGRNRILLFAAAALGLLLFAFAGAAVFATLTGGDDDGGSAAIGTPSPGVDLTPGVAEGTGTPGVSIDTATPDLTASAQPSATATETPAPSTPTPPPAPPTNTPPPAPPTATFTPPPPPTQGTPTRTPFIRLTPNPPAD